MNIENKKTALDDDSLLYQKRDDSLGKKDTSSLSPVQKLGYFRDYYLKAVIVGVIILAIAASLIYNMFFRHQYTALSVAFLNDARIVDTQALSQDLYQYYGLTRADDFVDIENYNMDDYTLQMKFATLVAAKSIDAIVVSQEDFEYYAGLDYLIDLKQLLPADVYDKWKDRIVTGSVVDTDDNGNVIKTYPAAPYGIDISDCALFQNYEKIGDKAILGIVSNTERLDNVIYFLDYVADPSAEPVQTESPQT